VDEDGDLNKIMNVPFPFKPRKIVVPRRGELKWEQVIDEGETPRKSAQQWREWAVAMKIEGNYESEANPVRARARLITLGIKIYLVS